MNSDTLVLNADKFLSELAISIPIPPPAGRLWRWLKWNAIGRWKYKTIRCADGTSMLIGPIRYGRDTPRPPTKWQTRVYEAEIRVAKAIHERFRRGKSVSSDQKTMLFLLGDELPLSTLVALSKDEVEDIQSAARDWIEERLPSSHELLEAHMAATR